MCLLGKALRTTRVGPNWNYMTDRGKSVCVPPSHLLRLVHVESCAGCLGVCLGWVTKAQLCVCVGCR
jgi:hypothetical protein